MSERILHVALRTDFEQQPGLDKALRGVASEYRDVDWQKTSNVPSVVVQAAREIKPTLVFMQLQCAGVLEPHHVTELRANCDPQVIIVNWDGDQHYEPEHEARRWFVELGQACDTSLVVNKDHPLKYAEMGVRNAGYMQIGYDPEIYRPADLSRGAPVVFLGSRYQSHQRRNEIIERLAAALEPDELTVYGHGWQGSYAHTMIKQEYESAVYLSARAAISMSIRNDLRCYTSDRLFRILGSGGVALVERFAGMEDLGLNSENCIAWSGYDELLGAVRLACSTNLIHMRQAAVDLARTKHTWDVRIRELLGAANQLRMGTA